MAPLPEGYTKVTEFDGDSSNPSMPTRKCRKITLRVKIGCPFGGTSKCLSSTKFGKAALLEGYAQVAKICGNLLNTSMPTRKCPNITLRVKLRFRFMGTLKYLIGTKFSVAPLLEDCARVAKFDGDSSNRSMPTRKCQNITLRVKLGFGYLGTSKCSIGTQFSAAPVLANNAKVAKFGRDSSNISMPTRKCQNATLRVKLGLN